MHVGVVVDAHARRYLRNVGVRPQLELRRHRRGVLVDHQRDPQHAAAVACRQLGAQGYRHNRRILGAVGHLDGDDVGPIVHLAVVENVLDQAGPGIIGIGGCRRRKGCAEHDAQETGKAEQAETISGHGRALRRERGNGTSLQHCQPYSHSISENAAVALRALKSSNNCHRDRSSPAAVSGAAVIGLPLVTRARTSVASVWR